jgi:hypothetical protein
MRILGTVETDYQQASWSSIFEVINQSWFAFGKLSMDKQISSYRDPYFGLYRVLCPYAGFLLDSDLSAD